MSEINSHVILSHIDKQARILFWPASQVGICTIPLGVGMASDNIIAGLILSFLSVGFFKMFHKKFGKGRFRSIMYWYLPTSSKVIKMGVPPSHVRYWIR